MHAARRSRGRSAWSAAAARASRCSTRPSPRVRRRASSAERRRRRTLRRERRGCRRARPRILRAGRPRAKSAAQPARAAARGAAARRRRLRGAARGIQSASLMILIPTGAKEDILCAKFWDSFAQKAMFAARTIAETPMSGRAARGISAPRENITTRIFLERACRAEMKIPSAQAAQPRAPSAPQHLL